MEPSAKTPPDPSTARRRGASFLRASLICFAVAGVFWFGGVKGEVVSALVLLLGLVMLLLGLVNMRVALKKR